MRMYAILSCVGSLMLVLSTHGVVGDACQDKRIECTGKMSTNGMSALNQRQNVTGLKIVCDTYKLDVEACLRDLPSSCPPTSEFWDLLATFQNSYEQICGLDAICLIEMKACDIDMDTALNLSNSMAQNPPDTDKLNRICSQLMASGKPCLDKLMSECQSALNASLIIEFVINAVEGACGQEVQCALSVADCMAPFMNTSNSSESNIEHVCKVRDVLSCVDKEMSDECKSLPNVQSTLNMLPSLENVECGNQNRSEGLVDRCFQSAMGCVASQQFGGSGCSEVSLQISCIEKLNHTSCPLTEEKITFKELVTESVSICQDMSKSPEGWQNCTAFSQCVSRSPLVSSMMFMGMSLPTAETMKKMVDKVQDSQTWCQYLLDATGCYMSYASTCGFDQSAVSKLRAKNYELGNVCAQTSAGAIHYLAWSNLAILMVMLLSWWKNWLL